MPGIRTCLVLLSFLSTARGLNMGSFLSIVLKLYSYKDGDFGNQRKFEYLMRIFKIYNLTSDLRFLRPVMKVKYIDNCKAILDFKQMGLFLIYQGIWGLRARTIWLAERGIFPSQRPGNFLLASI